MNLDISTIISTTAPRVLSITTDIWPLVFIFVGLTIAGIIGGVIVGIPEIIADAYHNAQLRRWDRKWHNSPEGRMHDKWDSDSWNDRNNGLT